MKFPVWQTTMDVFDYLWQERRAAVRFCALPFAVFFILSVLGRMFFGVDQTKVSVPLAALGIIQLLIYLPILVTWYRLTVLGEDEVRRRPIFTLGRLEGRFLLWQIAVTAVVIAFAAVGVAVTALLSGLNQGGHSLILVIVTVVWTIGWIISALLLMTRLSMVLVLVALDQPVNLKTSWRMTSGMSWRLLGATALIVLAGIVVGALFKLVAFIIGAIAAIATASALRDILTYLELLGQSFAGLVGLLGIATLFGFVYKMLTANIPVAPATP